MEMKINKNNLLKSCRNAAKAIRKSFKKEHECIRIVLSKSGSYVEGMSNEINIVSYISPEELDGEIKFLVDAGTLISYLKGINSEHVIITFEEKIMTLKGDKIKVKIQTLPDTNWPDRPNLRESVNIPITTDMFKQTYHAVEQKNGDGKMECFCISWDDSDNIAVTTLDGHRIAKRGIAAVGDNHIMINSKTLMDVLEFIENDMNIIICDAGTDGYLKKAAVIQTNEEYVYIPLNDGVYFNIEKMLESINYKYSSKVSKPDILSKLSLLNNTGMPVKMWLKEGDIEMMSSSNLDEIKVNIESENQCLSHENYSGSPVGFRCSFMYEAIKSIDAETVTIKLGSSKDIICISDSENKDKEYVLPINLAS